MPEVTITKAELYRASDGWRWRSKAANGEVIASGEGYTRREDAEAAARASIPEGTPITTEDDEG